MNGMTRVKYELRASGVRPEQIDPLRSGIHSRGYLPHVKREGARYFVTFRLADSMPRAVLLRLQAERAERLKRLAALEPLAEEVETGTQSGQAVLEVQREYFREVEGYLDRGYGECWLRRVEIADLVAGAIRFFDGQRYQCKAWVVMPNHVHLVLWPMLNYTLSHILQSLKSYTGREANKLLNRPGRDFWQRESFDHWIRDDEEHARCCSYVEHNPVKARLCARPQEWKWSSTWQEPQPA